MANLSIKIDRAALEDSIFDIIGKKPRYLLRPATDEATKGLLLLRRRVVSEFNRHPVTQELKKKSSAGPGILPFGNLFSFLGFDAGAEPANNLRVIINNGIQLTGAYDYNRRLKRYYFRITRPTRDEMIEQTRDDLEWNVSSGSWVYAIEEGISGLSRYLFKGRNVSIPASRSGPAIQDKKRQIHPGAEFSGTPYLKEIWSFLESELEGVIN